MADLSISRAWDETRAILAGNSRLFIAVALALIVLPQIIAGVVAPAGGAGIGGGVLTLAAALLGLVSQLAFTRLTVGDRVAVGEAIGHGFRRFPIFFGAMVLLTLAYILMILPIAIIAAAMGVEVPQPGSAPTGDFTVLVAIIAVLVIALWPRFALMPPIASEEPIGPIRIIRRSWALTKGHYWRLLGLMILFAILAIALILPAGLIGGLLGKMISPNLEALSVGAFLMAAAGAIAQAVFTVVVSVLLARLYLQLLGAETRSEQPRA